MQGQGKEGRGKENAQVVLNRTVSEGAISSGRSVYGKYYKFRLRLVEETE